MKHQSTFNILQNYELLFVLTSIGGTGGGLSAMYLCILSSMERSPNSKSGASLLVRCILIPRYPLELRVAFEVTRHPLVAACILTAFINCF